MKTIGAVIVSYNSSAELKQCLESFFSQADDNLSLEACVIDNASIDNSLEVARRFKDTRVIENKVNTGFSVAVNQGLEHFIMKDFDYYLVLNPDAILQPTSLSSMIDAFTTHQKVGAVGPRMLHSDGSDGSDGYYLKAPTILTVLAFSTHLRPYSLKNKWLLNRYQERLTSESRAVQQIPGACMLTSREVVDDIGTLSEEFAIWFEDVEWSYRARKHGYKMWFDSFSAVVHDGGVSFSKWNDLNKAVTFYVSMKTFFRIHKPASYPFVVLVILLNSLALYLKNKDKSNLVFARKFLMAKKGILPQR